MGQNIATDGRRQRQQIVQEMIARHFPGGNAPKGLLIDLYRVLGEAELKGFSDCMTIWDRGASPANDGSPGLL